MVPKRGRKDQSVFWACPRWPACKVTVDNSLTNVAAAAQLPSTPSSPAASNISMGAQPQAWADGAMEERAELMRLRMDMEQQQWVLTQQQETLQQETLRAQQEFATARETLLLQQQQTLHLGIQQAMAGNVYEHAAPGMPSASGSASALGPQQDPDL